MEIREPVQLEMKFDAGLSERAELLLDRIDRFLEGMRISSYELRQVTTKLDEVTR